MARKSKKALLIEAISAVSQCPHIILDAPLDGEELFLLVKNAEAGDNVALVSLLKAMCEDTEAFRFAPAVEYFGNIALSRRVDEACDLIIGYSVRENLLFNLASSASSIIKDMSGIGDKYDEAFYQKIYALSLLDAARCEADAEKIAACANLFTSDFVGERIYLLSLANKINGIFSDELITLVRESAPYLTSLSTINTKSIGEHAPSPFDIENMIGFLRRYTLIEWREFWLRAIYEYANLYLGGDLSSFAKEALITVKARRSCQKRHAHAAAWLSYLCAITEKDSPDYDSLKKELESTLAECKFRGIHFDTTDSDELSRVIYESVYESSTECDKAYKKKQELGLEIVHTKNRYLLSAELSGHGKRGKYHFWDTRICFPIQGTKKPPVFGPVRVDTVNHVVSRGGVTKKTDQKLTSQILCSSEISTREAKSPLSIDLILDLAYICSSKCQNAEIRIRDCFESDGYYVFNCYFYLS
jgi:hypothetical protein